MNTQSEWQMVNHQLMTDDRRRIGEPPTAEEMLAYTRGELSPEQEDSVRERLVAYPELVRTLTEPFPAEGAEPGDEDYLSDDDFARHWQTMEEKRRVVVPFPDRRVPAVWRTLAAVAAIVAVTLGVMLWQTTSKLREPRAVWEEQVLYPDGHRGATGQPAPLTAKGESVLLVASLIGDYRFERYRLELVSVGRNRTIWSSAALPPPEDSTFAILVPRRFLEPGDYQVVVFGVAGTAAERLATYSVRVPKQ